MLMYRLHHESFNHLYIGKLARFGGKETSLLHERKIFAGLSFLVPLE
jgi:hypothetical protein